MRAKILYWLARRFDALGAWAHQAADPTCGVCGWHRSSPRHRRVTRCDDRPCQKPEEHHRFRGGK